MKIDRGQKILFIGDSITDCERRGAHAPLGWGYVKFFAGMLTVRHPERAITVINKGIGGDVFTGLRDRWSDDVIRNRPDWLSIKMSPPGGTEEDGLGGGAFGYVYVYLGSRADSTEDLIVNEGGE